MMMLDPFEISVDVTINPVEAIPQFVALEPCRLIFDQSIEVGTFRAAALAGELTLNVSFLSDYPNPRALIVALCEDGFTSADPFYCHEWRAGFSKAERSDRL